MEDLKARIADGVKLRWRSSLSGMSNEAVIVRHTGFGHSPTLGETVKFLSQKYGDNRAAFHREVALGTITKIGRVKVEPTIKVQHETSRQKAGVEVDSQSEADEDQPTLAIGEGDAMAEQAKASTRKSLDEMSEGHRKHIEKWDPHLEALRGEHVWASANRYSGRGDGPVYVVLKRASKDYVVVDYDTDKQTPVTKSKVLAGPFESSSEAMEAFKEYRTMAKAEREASKPVKTKSSTKKDASTSKAKAKPTAKKAPAKKAPAKRPTRKRPPTKAKTD